MNKRQRKKKIKKVFFDNPATTPITFCLFIGNDKKLVILPHRWNKKDNIREVIKNKKLVKFKKTTTNRFLKYFSHGTADMLNISKNSFQTIQEYCHNYENSLTIPMGLPPAEIGEFGGFIIPHNFKKYIRHRWSKEDNMKNIVKDNNHE